MARDQLQSVAQIREIMEGETAQAAEAMLLLRPRWKTADAVIDFIDTKLRPTGYRLVGASCGRLHGGTTCTSTM